MNTDLEIIHRDLKNNRLTLTLDGCRLKIIPGTSEEDKVKLIEFSKRIISYIDPYLTCSLRGLFVLYNNVWEIRLFSDSNRTRATFVYDRELPLCMVSKYLTGELKKTKKLFYTFYSRWKDKTKLYSDLNVITKQEDYQGIISMGKNALPFIFEILERRTEHLFTALKIITGKDPVHKDHRGMMERMREDWLAWGRNHDFLER